MTNNSTNNPQNEPARHDASRSGYNPITLGDVQKSSGPGGWDPLGGRDINLVRCIAVPFFVLIFGFSWHRFESSALCVIVLLGCLLARMDARQRQLAAIPLSLAAIKLGFQLATYFSPLASWMPGVPPNGPSQNFDFGMPWLPIFYSVCLFYVPNKDSVTLKIVFVSSIALLASGLLPSEGFIAIFAVLHYTIYFAIVVGLFLDLKPGAFAPPAQPAVSGAHS